MLSSATFVVAQDELFWSLIRYIFPVLGMFTMAISAHYVMPKRRGGTSKRPQSSLTTSGNQELIDVTVAGTSFTGGALRLIPSFAEGSRLDILAGQFSQYQILSSVVEFRTVTTTNTSGRIAMAWSFDLKDPDPTSVGQILQTARSRSDVPWKNFRTTMPPRPTEKRRYAYISSADYILLPLADQQQYTPASLIFGVDSSQQNGLLVGKLIWHYRIQFFNPNVTSQPTGNNLYRSLLPASQVEHSSEQGEPPSSPSALTV